MTEHILVERRDAILFLRLNRPEKRNALTADMYEALIDAITDAPGHARVIVITGSGGSFSAGNDLAAFTGPRTAPFGQSPAARFMKALVRNPVPIIAAVNGFAVGIGVTMLLHCDLKKGFVYQATECRDERKSGGKTEG